MILLKALSLEATPRRPIWIMRQAGRYLQSYRAIKEKNTFEGMCADPEMALKVSLLPLKQYDLDAAIVFNDILIPLKAMGVPLQFEESGPKLQHPKTLHELQALRKDFNPLRDTPSILKTLSLLRKEVPKEKAVLGFAGAPFTMLTYLLEGRTGKDFAITKKWMATYPEEIKATLKVLAKAMGEYLDAQAHAGADAVQLFDTWASVLSPKDYETFALPYAREVMSAVSVPCIYYVNGIAGILEQAAATGAQALSIDWRLSMKEARKRLSPVVAIQGNLDPHILLRSTHEIREAAWQVCRDYGELPGHIFNLGHGIVPEIPEAAVQTLIEAVRDFKN